METKQTTAVTTQEKNITDEVLAKINAFKEKGELQIPQNYSAPNALKSAWLILQETMDKEKKPVLQSCTKASIANCLLDMVIQGLSPSKKQCYYVAYGNKLQLMRSYMGTVAVTKRLNGVKNVYANCIYEGDEFEYEIDLETGIKKITKHNQKFENIDPAKIKGAYAVIVREDGQNYVEIMNINQIRKAWGQGIAYASGKSTAHNNFTDEMAKKTVINRACKLFVNTTDDSDILVGAINNSSTEHDESAMVNDVEYEVQEEINEKGNSKEFNPPPTQESETAVKGKESSSKASKAEQVTMEGPGF